MKKIFTLLALAACCAAMTWGCSDDKYDDTEIRQEIENLKQEIASMKEQVNSLKTIIDALNENKFITNYTEAADGSCTITFNDGKTITLHNGKDGAAAPVIGIAQFEGVYYWTLGGDDQWLLDDDKNKIPVAGQDGKTPTVNEDGYWEIDGETIKGEDGQPIKAVGKDGANGDKGEDGDSFFKSVVQDADNVTFTLTNGDQIVLPKAKEVNFVIERTSLTLKFGASQDLAVTQKGVETLAITKPDGWRAWLEGDVLTITAPAKENVYAETSGEVSVVAVGASSFTALEFPLLETIGNGEPVSDDPADDYALYTMPSGCAGEFILPSLQRVNGSMLVSTWNTSTDRAVAFRFPSLQSVAGEISVGHTAYKNRSVATLDFSALTAAGAIRIGNLSSVTDFSTFTQVLPRLSEQTWSVTDCGYNPTYQQMLDGETGAESK